MLEEARQDSGLGSLISRRWRVMALAGAITLASGALVLSLLPKHFEATAKFLVMRPEQRTGGLKLGNGGLPELTRDSHPLYTQVELLRISPVLREVFGKLRLEDARGKPVSREAFARNLRIRPIKDTDIIEVAYRDRDGGRAKHVVGALYGAYRKHMEQYRRQGVREGLRIADEHLETARKRLRQTENDLLKFQRRSNSIALAEQITASIREVTSLDSDTRQRRIELERVRTRAESLRSRLGMSAREGMAMIAAAQSTRVRSLQEQLIAAETAPVFTQGLSDRHPDLVAARKRVAMLRESLAKEIRAVAGHSLPDGQLDDVRQGLLRELVSAETEVVSLNAAIRATAQSRSGLQSSLASLPEREIVLARLAREVEIAREIYHQRLAAREDARASLSIAPSYVVVVQPPEVPARPSGPLGSHGWPLLFVTSLAAGLGAGLLRDLLDRRLDPRDLGTFLPEIKIFPALPHLSWSERRRGELAVPGGSNPHYLEAVKTLALALEDTPGGPGGQVVAITSSLPQEGKSLTIANLALCLAEAEHRVLLVDGDLRQPRLHQIFDRPIGAPGLSDLLEGTVPPAEAVQHVGAIDLVQAGRVHLAVRPGKLRKRLKPIIDAWRSEYDFVLIDLPPVAFADVAHFARHSDGVLLLANLERITPDMLLSSIERLRTVRIAILGVAAISMAESVPQARYYHLLPEPEAAE